MDRSAEAQTDICDVKCTAQYMIWSGTRLVANSHRLIRRVILLQVIYDKVPVLLSKK